MTNNLSDTAPVREGDVLAGKYRVDRVLGVGGMGVVVAATHLQLEQRVALKFMLPWALANKLAVERFSREARAAVRLKSEHVARVLDVGTLESGSPYMVMEFLEGIDLHDLIHQPDHKVAVEDAVDFLLQACDAVAEAHALGIVHRDLKPRNLFLSTGNDGKPHVKVLDFGISKISTGSGDLSLTRTSEIIGSPNYMSPEQLKASRDVDGRTDIWALGVILYELLGGEVPFVAETLTQLTALVLQEAPRPLKDIRPEVPPGIVAVISRCLEKDPNQRFPNIAALAAALARYAPEHARGLAERVQRVEAASRGPGSVVAAPSSPGNRPGSPGGAGTGVSWAETELATTPPPQQRKSRVALLGAGALLVCVVGASGVYVVTRHPHPPVAAGTQAPPSGATPPTQPGTGNPLAPTTGGTGGAGIAVNPPPLTPPTAPPGPATSPATTPTRPGGTRPHGGTTAHPPGTSGARRDAGTGDDMPSERL